MPFEPEWVALNQRSTDIKDKVNQIHNLYANKQIFSEAIDLYLDQEWGSLQQSVLYRGLLECSRRQEILSAAAMVELLPQPIASSEVGHRKMKSKNRL